MPELGGGLPTGDQGWGDGQGPVNDEHVFFDEQLLDVEPDASERAERSDLSFVRVFEMSGLGLQGTQGQGGVLVTRVQRVLRPCPGTISMAVGGS